MNVAIRTSQDVALVSVHQVRISQVVRGKTWGGK